ncbi:unnamed protein product, partial [Heterosigma akashiwo]
RQAGPQGGGRVVGQPGQGGHNSQGQAPVGPRRLRQRPLAHPLGDRGHQPGRAVVPRLVQLCVRPGRVASPQGSNDGPEFGQRPIFVLGNRRRTPPQVTGIIQVIFHQVKGHLKLKPPNVIFGEVTLLFCIQKLQLLQSY